MADEEFTMRRMLMSAAVAAVAMCAVLVGAAPANAAIAEYGQQIHYVFRSNAKSISSVSIVMGDGTRRSWSDVSFKKETPRYWFNKHTFRTTRSEVYASSSLQTNSSSNNAWVECELWVGGVLEEHEVSQGPYSVVFC
jgi:hypothetical protein